jgi:hypothetical protein
VVEEGSGEDVGVPAESVPVPLVVEVESPVSDSVAAGPLVSDESEQAVARTTNERKSEIRIRASMHAFGARCDDVRESLSESSRGLVPSLRERGAASTLTGWENTLPRNPAVD